VVQLGLGYERLQQLLFFLIFFVPVKVQQVIDAQAMGRNHKTISGNIGLQGAGSTHSDDVQWGKVGLYGTVNEVDIDQGVEFVQHNINIIGANARRNDGEPFFAQDAGMGHKFAVAAFVLNAVEVFTNDGHPVGVANGDNGLGQFFGPQVEVVNGPPFVDNQFRFLNALHKKGLKRLAKYPTNILLLHTPFETSGLVSK